MGLEAIVLNEKSQEKKNTARYYLYVKSKNKTKHKNIRLKEKEIRFIITRDRRWEERKLEESGQKVQTSSCKMNNYLGCNVQLDDYS